LDLIDVVGCQTSTDVSFDDNLSSLVLRTRMDWCHLQVLGAPCSCMPSYIISIIIITIHILPALMPVVNIPVSSD
jgi:hypothetical protein